jgi:hypothetical protein
MTLTNLAFKSFGHSDDYRFVRPSIPEVGAPQLLLAPVNRSLCITWRVIESAEAVARKLVSLLNAQSSFP